MIYEPVDPNELIRQGDIFVNVPKVEAPDLSKIRRAKFDPHSGAVTSVGDTGWAQWLGDPSRGTGAVVLPVRAVTGIVISQDCDAVRCDNLLLCTISPVPKLGDTPKKRVGAIRSAMKGSPRLFYLPEAGGFQIPVPSFADFDDTFVVSRAGLESLRAVEGRQSLETLT